MERKVLALTLALLPTATWAEQQRPCAPHDTISMALEKEYGEQARAMGLAQDNTVMEVYASEESGTWTLTVTMPNGLTCLGASGKSFETIAPTKVKGAPA